ncbi:MAG: caspase family protein [Lewinellaceae bacterium]|nr:caspase family protein [Lewinellaceae bacterium]
MPTLYALFAAINDYPNPDHRLKGCLNDRRAVEAYVSEFCQSRGITYRPKVLEDHQATRDEVIRGFDHFNQAAPGDRCLFFFAGHGSCSPAPPEFWHLEPDRMNESLVCYDSRTADGRDLMDKELSHLIWKATWDAEREDYKEVHFLVVTDCCHSGSVTRMPGGVRRRQVRCSELSTPASEYLGFEAYIKEGEGQYSPRRGRYVHLAAAQPHEEAKEVCVSKVPHGIFSHCLLEALTGTLGHISYLELQNRTGIRVRSMFADQSPRLEAPLAADKSLLFLSGNAAPPKGELLASYDKALGWVVNAGAFQGIRLSPAVPVPRFFLPEEGLEVQVVEVLPGQSRLEGTAGLDKRRVYKASFMDALEPAAAMAFAPHAEPEGKLALERAWQQRKPKFVRLADSPGEAQYVIHAEKGRFFLTTPCERRPLFKPLEGYHETAAAAFLDGLGKVANWSYVLNLSNPFSTISDDEFKMELYRVTEPGNYASDAPHELVDWKSPPELPYLSEGGQWFNPAFKLRVKNTGNRDLWVSVLYLGKDFSITNELLATQRLKPGEEEWARFPDPKGKPSRAVRVVLDKAYRSWGLSTIEEFLKVIITTSRFDSDGLYQDGLAQEAREDTLRALDRSASLPTEDWTAKEISLRIHRPDSP